jgi:hypothetical protein
MNPNAYPPAGNVAVAPEQPSIHKLMDRIEKELVAAHQHCTRIENAVDRIKAVPQAAATGSDTLATPRPVPTVETRLRDIEEMAHRLNAALLGVGDRLDSAV